MQCCFSQLRFNWQIRLRDYIFTAVSFCLIPWAASIWIARCICSISECDLLVALIKFLCGCLCVSLFYCSIMLRACISFMSPLQLFDFQGCGPNGWENDGPSKGIERMAETVGSAKMAAFAAQIRTAATTAPTWKAGWITRRTPQGEGHRLKKESQAATTKTAIGLLGNPRYINR